MKGLLLSLVSLLITLLLAEGILRLTTEMREIRFKCHYPMLGNQYCRNVTSIHPESGNTIVTNSHGLLDKDYALQPTPGTIRIAVIGDSFVAGEEVKFGATFHELWEEQLPDLIGTPVEILNFGVSGIGTWKQLQTFHLRVRAFNPDVTVLAFYWGNDLINALVNSKKGYANPLFDEYPVDSLFEQAQVLRKRFNQNLWNHSALYQFTYVRYPILKQRIKSLFDPAYKLPDKAKAAPDRAVSTTKDVLSQRKKMNPPPRPKHDTRSYFDDPYFLDSESWQLGKKLILKLRDEVEGAGGTLVVMHFLSHQQYLERWPLPTNALNEFLSQNSIAYIDPNPSFRDLTPDKLNTLYIPGDIHMNEEGHLFLSTVTLNEIASKINGVNLMIPH